MYPISKDESFFASKNIHIDDIRPFFYFRGEILQYLS